MKKSLLHITKLHVSLGIVTGLLLLAISIVAPLRASAMYVEGNLVDDTMFLDAGSMSHQQIQNFLVARGGALANYSSWSGRNSATVSASQIIYEAAYDYGINPKVLLATLQKEQSLVTAKNPTSSQLNFAMGYGCPDSTGCGEKYKGFYNQVDNGAWQLRYNFERARGNNTWWRVSSSYACGGATRYYSTGLYLGRTVTFYDEVGYGYKTFKLNGAASASLYCYTPHAYPGSSTQYYSGSYNFVVAYENWFGSTQPTVVISSPLRVTGTGTPGLFTNNTVTAAFEVTNNTGNAINVGGMAVAARDGDGANRDFALKPMVIPAWGTVTYSSSQTLTKDGNYTFWITNQDPNGAWSDTYPVSSSIDNERRHTLAVQPMPLITVQPAPNSADLRQGKAAQYSFTVQNTSATKAISLGRMALAIRTPSGGNADLPLTAAINVPANSTYTYTQPFTPTERGTYTAFITQTPDNGGTWYENHYPAVANGVNRRVNFAVNTSPTLTQGPTMSAATPRVGQQVAATFKVKNYGNAAVNAGILGMAIRDPQGRNVDAGSVALTVNADTEYTFSANKTFTVPGTYTAWITGTRDGGKTWDDMSFPAAENNTIQRKVTFTVLPNPTITVQPTITTANPRTGKGLTATFTLHNYANQPIDIGYLALAARDPQGRNVDFALQQITIPAGSNYVYTATNPGAKYQRAGTYTAWITGTRDGSVWDDTSYPVAESAAINRRITFAVAESPTLTQGPTMSVASPQVGQQVTATFKVRNYGDAPVAVGVIGMAIRDPQGRNVDAGSVDLTVSANNEYTFSANKTFTLAGTYTAWITVTRDGGATWDDTSYPPPESGSVLRKVTFTVQP